MEAETKAPFSRKSYPPPASARKLNHRMPNPAVGTKGVDASCMFLNVPTLNDRNSVRIVCSIPRLKSWLFTPGTKVLFEVTSTSAVKVKVE